MLHTPQLEIDCVPYNQVCFACFRWCLVVLYGVVVRVLVYARVGAVSVRHECDCVLLYYYYYSTLLQSSLMLHIHHRYQPVHHKIVGDDRYECD